MKILEGLKTSPTTMSSTSTSSSTVSVGIVLGFRAINEFSAIDICGKLALDAFWKLVSGTFPAAAVVVEVDKLDVIDVSDVVIFLMVEDGAETVT